MKKLTFTQGKLLIKLVDRECNQSSASSAKSKPASSNTRRFLEFDTLKHLLKTR